MYEVPDSCLKVAASSQTDSHQTLLRVLGKTCQWSGLGAEGFGDVEVCLPSAQTVDTLGLAGADDDVGEGGTVLEDKHGLVLAGLILVLADGGYPGDSLANPTMEDAISW